MELLRNTGHVITGSANRRNFWEIHSQRLIVWSWTQACAQFTAPQAMASMAANTQGDGL
jgi:predicted P-loop ATPase